MSNFILKRTGKAYILFLHKIELLIDHRQNYIIHGGYTLFWMRFCQLHYNKMQQLISLYIFCIRISVLNTEIKPTFSSVIMVWQNCESLSFKLTCTYIESFKTKIIGKQYWYCKQVFAQKLEASNNFVQFKESEREQFTVYKY